MINHRICQDEISSMSYNEKVFISPDELLLAAPWYNNYIRENEWNYYKLKQEGISDFYEPIIWNRSYFTHNDQERNKIK
jgi:hypothetical protein